MDLFTDTQVVASWVSTEHIRLFRCPVVRHATCNPHPCLRVCNPTDRIAVARAADGVCWLTRFPLVKGDDYVYCYNPTLRALVLRICPSVSTRLHGKSFRQPTRNAKLPARRYPCDWMQFYILPRMEAADTYLGGEGRS